MPMNLFTELFKSTMAKTDRLPEAEPVTLTDRVAADEPAIRDGASRDADAGATTTTGRDTDGTAEDPRAEVPQTGDPHADAGADRAAPALPMLSADDLAADDLADLTTAYRTVRDALADAVVADLPADRFQAGESPLAQILADATGDSTADIQDLLKQVGAAVRQERPAEADTTETADAGRTPEAAPAGDETATLWHDRVEQWLSRGNDGTQAERPATNLSDADRLDIPAMEAVTRWHDAALSPRPADAGTEATDAEVRIPADAAEAVDGADAVLHHHIARQPETAELSDTVVSAVDAFRGVIEDLHLVPAHGQPVDLSSLDTAA